MAFKIEVSASFNIKELTDKDRAYGPDTNLLPMRTQLTSGFLKSTYQPQHVSIVPGFLPSVLLRISPS